MNIIILVSVLLVGGLLALYLSILKASISKLLSGSEEVSEYSYSLRETLTSVRQIRTVVLVLTLLFAVCWATYLGVRGTPMQAFVMEWLNLLIRWAHVVAGIMWIGASFYFIFLENNLNRTKGVRDELAGNLWAIHGGGFYFLEKYKVAPKEVPKDLHWFKYEAYFTWITGFSLLAVVYYMDAKSFLINPDFLLSEGAAIGIGMATLVVGWFVYDGLCKSRIGRNNVLFSLIGFALLVAVSYFLTVVFNSRAAYIHVGALIGTLMVGNVFFGIIPAQKALVKAAVLGKPLDPTLGQKAGERSLHNNYLTLPVIFIMISNHFPSTYGHEFSWLILMVITVASAGIKHYWNLLERGQRSKYILPVSIVALISLALVTSPMFEKVDEDLKDVSFVQVNDIIQSRCVQCHSSAPTDDQWNQAPNNVMFDTPEDIKKQADRILVRTVRTQTMPLGNKTEMTEEERNVIKAWILNGANIDE